ncbi:MAG: phage major capsid protein [Spirochaetales bacterium]|nr:phage major capsid protein [Spirochaetales bacterium]
MSKILELREKRAKLWEETKAFLDSKRDDKGLICAEDTATYEKMETDVVNLGKEIERLERQTALDLELAQPVNAPIKNNPAKPDEEKTGRASNEYKQAFWKALRNKHSYDVQNALQIGTDSEGGYLVPDEFERTLIEALAEENLMRQVANVITTSFGDKKIPVVASKGTADWTDEEAAMHESDEAFGVVTLGAHKLTTMIKVSEELLNDSVFNLENYIAKEFARRIGRAEEEAFIVGNGTGKPTGSVNSADVGVTTAGAAIIMDEIIDLYYALREPYRRNAIFITNDATIKAVRKLKDGSGQYLWQPSVQAGRRDTILNKPVRTSRRTLKTSERNSIRSSHCLDWRKKSHWPGGLWHTLKKVTLFRNCHASWTLSSVKHR